MRRALAVVLALSSAGCAYFNSMWTAERYANDARRFERRGQVSEARSQWALAAERAERVVMRHPRSRWADDALALQAEGLARSGACAKAAGPIARVRASVADVALRERAGLAAAECALAAGDPVQATAALALPLVSKDAGRRSRAEYLAGRAAALRLDYAGANEHYERSREPAARFERVVGLQRVRIAHASQRGDLVPIAAELERLRGEGEGAAAKPLLDLVNKVLTPGGTHGARFRLAELARDSLSAPRLAGRMFLEVAAGDTASLYAAKALLAALAMLPESRDSIVVALDTRYASSPYTRVFHGEASVAYAAAEDSLARELGVSVARSGAASTGVRFELPLPGPRGPRP